MFAGVYVGIKKNREILPKGGTRCYSWLSSPLSPMVESIMQKKQVNQMGVVKVGEIELIRR